MTVFSVTTPPLDLPALRDVPLGAGASPLSEVPGEDPARKQLLDRLCLGGIAFHVLLRTVCSFLRAYLLSNPLLYVFLVSSATALITAGAFARVGRLSLWVVVPAALVGLAGFDLFYYWAGHRFRHRLHADLVKLFALPEKWLDRAERWMGRFGAWLLLLRFFQPIPNQLLHLFAGSGRMPLVRYVVANLSGAALFGGLLLWAGWAAGESAVRVVDVIAAHALKVTIGLVVLSVVWNVSKARRLARSS